MNAFKIGLTIFSIVLFLASCNKVDSDIVRKVTITVDSKTKEYSPWGSETICEGLNINEKDSKEWMVIGIDAIEGFKYEEGYEYSLLVEITVLANPPLDDTNHRYKMIELISKTKQ